MSAIQLPQDRNDELEFATWVRSEAEKALQEQGIGSEIQRGMLSFWQRHRPKMWDQLQRLGLAEQLALVLEVKAEEQSRKSRAGGMHWREAQAEAERFWYLMDKESVHSEDDAEDWYLMDKESAGSEDDAEEEEY